jgi:hypothetical protein
MGSTREAIEAAYENLDAAFDAVAALSYDVLTTREKRNLLGRLEVLRRRQPAAEHLLINQLVTEYAPAVLGGTSLADVLSTYLRIGTGEAKRRIGEAADLGERTALSGESLGPVLPTVAKVQAAGEVGAEHIRIIRKALGKLPDAVDAASRAHAEAQLATLATELGPAELEAEADHVVYLLDQDGPAPTDAERARKRFLKAGKQQADGMTPITGLLDPEAMATWEAVQAKLGAPGMCNPDDRRPCVDGEPSDAARHGDTRSQPQRNHDAFTAMGRALLASGHLGQHSGLPATIIVSTTLQQLESAAGQAVTAGGTLLPMSDVIRLASHAHHYLTIFDKHTKEPLYLGRSKRLASKGQRIVLHARDRGCTFPGCTVPGYGCQVHHGKKGWAKGGNTNIDEEVLACGPHNRLIEKGGWTTRIRKDGRTEWIPPPHLDTGQARVNNFHHPERYLLPDEDDQSSH